MYKKQKPENNEYFFGKKYSYEINNLFAISDNIDDEFQNIFPFEHSNFHEIISYRCKFFGCACFSWKDIILNLENSGHKICRLISFKFWWIR